MQEWQDPSTGECHDDFRPRILRRRADTPSRMGNSAKVWGLKKSDGISATVTELTPFRPATIAENENTRCRLLNGAIGERLSAIPEEIGIVLVKQWLFQRGNAHSAQLTGR